MTDDEQPKRGPWKCVYDFLANGNGGWLTEEEVERIRAVGPRLTKVEAVLLWEQFSTDVFCAQILVVEDYYLEEFKKYMVIPII